MSFGHRRGWSDCIIGVRARNLLTAHEFAAEIARPLNVSVNINWSKTTAADDTHGHLLRGFRKAAGRWLRDHGAGGLTCTWARERPTHPVPRPNAHLNCHVPLALYDRFVKRAHCFLPQGCSGLELDAIWIELIGITLDDSRRRSEYLVKGAHQKARLQIRRKRIAQGRIYGKRCGTSEDIGAAARLRWQEQQENSSQAIPF